MAWQVGLSMSSATTHTGSLVRYRPYVARTPFWFWRRCAKPLDEFGNVLFDRLEAL